jgi:hypothetical protein
MIAKIAAFALTLTVTTAAVMGPALADDRHRHHRQGHHAYGHPGHGHGGHLRRHWYGNSARIVLWQPAPVYRAYPAPVYVPAPVVYQPPAVEAVPLRTFHDTSGRYCREYQRMADIGGVQQQIFGTACMMPDGSWQIVSE